jgi:hypothetical protein
MSKTNTFEVDTLQNVFEWIEAEVENGDEDLDWILEEYVTRAFMYYAEQDELVKQYGLELVEMSLNYIKEMGTGLFLDRFVEYALWQVIDNNDDTIKQHYDTMVLSHKRGNK